MPLPPVYDENGNVEALDPDEHYRRWARILVQNHAGGWHPDSVPGKQAMAEFEAFVRETQARAVEAFLAQWNHDEGVTGGPPWWVEAKAEEYAEHIRAGRTDLSGNRLAS